MVYVDRAQVPFKEKVWCHLMADTLAELHDFARKMKIDSRLFHRTASYPHYDIPVEMREIVVLNGAQIADRKTIIACGKKLKIELANLEC